MKLLITGANGQLGRCLIDRAGVDDLFEFEAYGSAELDITNSQQVEEALDTYRPDIVINAAAYTAVDRAESEPERAAKVNVIGPANLSAASKNTGAFLIHISTDYVFDGENSVPYRESDATSPLGVYGQTKLEGEQMIHASGVEHLILRTAWVFSEYGNNFLKSMLKLAETKSHPGIVADQQGCPTYAGDIAQTILDICRRNTHQSPERGIFHYVGATACSWADFARQIFAFAKEMDMLKNEPQVENIATAQYPTPAKRPVYSILDTGKIQARYGVNPRSLDKALSEALVALKQRNEAQEQ